MSKHEGSSGPGPQPFLRFRPLHTRVGLVVAALVVSFALALGLVLASTARQDLGDLQASGLQGLADQMSRELSRGMDQFQREVVSEATRQVYRDSGAQAAEMRFALDAFKALNPEFAYASIVDAGTARVIAATGGIFEGGSGRGRPTFEEGLKGPFVGDVHDAVRLAELLPKPASGETLRFLDVAAPIRDASGRVIRVFAAHVAWEWTRTVREMVFEPLRDRRGIELVLGDTRDKVVLAASSELAVGTDLSATLAVIRSADGAVPWPDRGRFLSAVSDVQPHGTFPGFGWKVIARQPDRLAMAPLERLRTAFLLVALALGLVAAALGWLLSARMTRPVQALADLAWQADSRHGVSALPPGAAIGEVGVVHAALSRLADAARAEASASAASERRFAVLAASLPQVVWLARANGSMEYANRPWLVDAAGGRHRSVDDLAEWIDEDDERQQFRRMWAHSRGSGEPLAIRCRMSTPGSEAARWCEIHGAAVANDDASVSHWIGTILDVDESVVLAIAMQRALDEERRAREGAERLARMKDEFLSTVSHELRSPLNAISGWGEILGRRSDGDPLGRRASEAIRRNTAAQASLIEDLIDLSAAVGRTLVLNPVDMDLAQAALMATHAQRPEALAKGVTLACTADAPVGVHGDVERVVQILAILLRNAVKFTDEGGRIDVSTLRDHAWGVVRVRDTGRGIGSEYLPHVFDRLRQEDGSFARAKGGLGLGLSLAKALVELSQGRIDVHSDGLGRGATFTVRLPYRELKPQPVASPVASPAVPPDAAADTESLPDLTGLDVLLVDDEADAREVTSMALASLGADVTCADGGPQALQLFAGRRFDLLVSDIGMPGMDGLALLQSIRSSPTGRTVPAIALTAFSLGSQVQAGLAAGFQAYLVKPVSMETLARCVAATRHEAAS